MRTRIPALALAGLLALGAVACSDDGGDTDPAGAVEEDAPAGDAAAPTDDLTAPTDAMAEPTE